MAPPPPTSPPAGPDALLRWMTGLGDSARLRVLGLLERHELAVSDLCDVLQMPQSTVSRHLKLLADEGWLVSRRRGTTNLYRMVADELQPAQRELWRLTREQTAGWPTTGQDEARLARVLSDRGRGEGGEAFFAGAAAEWDRLRRDLYGSTFTRDALLALLPPTWTVADLGCGTGTITAELARCVAKVVGVDNSPAMLDAARATTRGLSNVDLLPGELTDLPLGDASCDAAVCVLVLSYVDDVAAAVGEIARVVRPGGRVVVLDLLRHDREEFRRTYGQANMGFEPGELRAMLEAAGLVEVDVRALPPEPETKGPALLLARGGRSVDVDA